MATGATGCPAVGCVAGGVSAGVACLATYGYVLVVLVMASPVVCLEAVGVMTGVAICADIVRRVGDEACGVIVGGVALVANLFPVRCRRQACRRAGLGC